MGVPGLAFLFYVMLDTSILDSLEDSFAENFLDQYLSSMTDYVLVLAATLRNLPDEGVEGYIPISEQEEVLDQMGRILGIVIDMELWSLADEVIFIINKLGAK